MITRSRSLPVVLLITALCLMAGTVFSGQSPASSGDMARANYLIIVLSLFLFWLIYRSYGQRPTTGNPPPTTRGTLPGGERPAAVGWLLGGRSVGLHALSATLFDLAHRGYLILSEGDPVTVRMKGELPSFTVESTGKNGEGDLKEWEHHLLHLIDRQHENAPLDLRSLLDSLHTSGAGWFDRWQEQLETYGYGRGWVDQKSFTGAYLNAGLQMGLFMLGLIMALNSGPSSPVILFAMLLVTLLAAGLSAVIPHRTQEGERTYRKWSQYRSDLLSSGLGTGELSLHLIYSMALQLNPEQILPPPNQKGSGTEWVSWLRPRPSSKFTPLEVYRSLLSIPNEQW